MQMRFSRGANLAVSGPEQIFHDRVRERKNLRVCATKMNTSSKFLFDEQEKNFLILLSRSLEQPKCVVMCRVGILKRIHIKTHRPRMINSMIYSRRKLIMLKFLTCVGQNTESVQVDEMMTTHCLNDKKPYCYAPAEITAPSIEQYKSADPFMFLIQGNLAWRW